MVESGAIRVYAKTMRAGYYANSKKQQFIAIRFSTSAESTLELFFDDQRRIVKYENNQFTVNLNGKIYCYVYSELENGKFIIVRSLRNKKNNTIEYEFESPWPNELPKQIKFHHPADCESLYEELKKSGFSILENIQSPNELLEVSKYFYRPDKNKNKRGWFAVSIDDTDAKVKAYLDQLIEPASIYLDRMLGSGKWEHNNTLQVAYAEFSKTAVIPTYHIDKMFLNKGEPFSLLVGIPLEGKTDQELSGNLSVVSGSHLSLQGLVQKSDDSFLLNDEIHKNDKLKQLYEFSKGEIRFDCVKAIPGDMFFCHYRLIHGVEKNFTAARSIAYVRIRVKNSVKEQKNVSKISSWVESVRKYGAFDLWES